MRLQETRSSPRGAARAAAGSRAVAQVLQAVQGNCTDAHPSPLSGASVEKNSARPSFSGQSEMQPGMPDYESYSCTTIRFAFSSNDFMTMKSRSGPAEHRESRRYLVQAIRRELTVAIKDDEARDGARPRWTGP